MIVSLSLESKGPKGECSTFCLIISLILELSTYSKLVSWSSQYQETHFREKYFLDYEILYV